jgi:hypothetical protein
MVERHPSFPPIPAPEHRIGRRSVGFMERGGRRWSCFLVTYPDGEGSWRGHFSFRPSDGLDDGEETRTTEIFLEPTEAGIRQKARELGRPLLGALLDSALHVRSRAADDSPFLRRWLRELLSENSLLASHPEGASEEPPDLESLRSLYASYRLDQVAHFIALVGADDFERAVTAILEGKGVDFAARDRLQLAMLVVTYIEERLPLPPFEIWVRDYLPNRDRYRVYAHALHREGRLP